MPEPLTVTEVAQKFLGADTSDVTETDAANHFAQVLRNLIQRARIQPAARQGRAVLFDTAGACVIRLAYALAGTELPRRNWATYASWLGETLPSGESRISDAVKRARAGETFEHSIRFDVQGTAYSDTGTADAADERGVKALKTALALGFVPESLSPRMVLPAAALIRDTLKRLGEH